MLPTPLQGCAANNERTDTSINEASPPHVFTNGHNNKLENIIILNLLKLSVRVGDFKNNDSRVLGIFKTSCFQISMCQNLNLLTLLFPKTSENASNFVLFNLFPITCSYLHKRFLDVGGGDFAVGQALAAALHLVGAWACPEFGATLAVRPIALAVRPLIALAARPLIAVRIESGIFITIALLRGAIKKFLEHVWGWIGNLAIIDQALQAIL